MTTTHEDGAATAALVDVWGWTSRKEFDLEELLELRSAILVDKEARREFDQNLEESEGTEAGRSVASKVRGIALWLKGDYAGSYGFLKSHSSDPVAVYALSQACLYGGHSGLDGTIQRPKEAAALMKGVSNPTVRHRALHLRALVLCRETEEAAKVLKRAGDAFKNSADGYYFAGKLASLENEGDVANDAWEKALEVDPEHPATLFDLAYHSDLSGDDDQAIELYERLADRPSPPVNALINLGVLYEDHDRYDDAAFTYRRVLAAYPQHPRARLFLKDAVASQNMFYDEEQEVRNDKKAQILKIPVSDFELSVRSRNCLAKMNLNTLGDLVIKSEAELLSYKNFGETSLNEIKQILESKGLRLGMRPEDDLLPVKRGDGTPVAAGTSAPTGLSVDPNDERLQKSVGELTLSVRSRKCLASLNIKLIGDLVQYTEDDLLSQRNFGVTSLKEIRDQIIGIGLTFRTVDK